MELISERFAYYGWVEMPTLEVRLHIQARDSPRAHSAASEDRAHFVVPTDYPDGSELDIMVEGILGRIAH